MNGRRMFPAGLLVLALALAAAPAIAVTEPVARPAAEPVVHPAAEPASSSGVFIVQALPDSVVSVSVDESKVSPKVSAGEILGPLSLTPGTHSLTVTGRNPAWTMNASVRTTSRGSIDVVLHRPASVGGRPTVTVYRNPVRPVAAGKGRVLVAHTATVPPADVTVDRRVVFANIANGEFATAEVPAGSHQVSIVPTGGTGPALLGPVDLKAKPESLTQVFAVGQPANGSMDVIVQTLPLETRGSPAPDKVKTGSAGLVADLPVPAATPLASVDP